MFTLNWLVTFWRKIFSWGTGAVILVAAWEFLNKNFKSFIVKSSSNESEKDLKKLDSTVSRANEGWEAEGKSIDEKKNSS